MKRTRIFLLLACAALLCAGSGRPEPVGIRVLCYNIHHANPPSKPGEIDLEAVARVIREAQPDLVALQEIDVRTQRSGPLHQAEELARMTGLHAFFSKAIDYQGGEYGVAVLSRFPIVESRGFALPMADGVRGEPRTVAAVVVEPVPGRRIAFASTHLDLREENRNVQIDAIVAEAVRAGMPVVLAGDFNARPDSYVIRTLDKTFRRTCSDCDPTFPANKPNRVIDFIAYTPQGAFEVVRHRVVPEEYASDHRPVFATLTYKQ